MKLRRIGVGFALASLIMAGSSAVADEREDVLAVMDKAYAAILSRRPEDWKGIIVPEGNVLSFRPLAGGAPGELEMRMQSNAEQIANDHSDGPKLVERWTSEPDILIRGPIAAIWGDYDFWIDDEFSHCGGTSVTLAKVEGTWMIANWMWTVEKEHCPTDPASD
jgi:hypothetical protein